jgi:hypothetical protein
MSQETGFRSQELQNGSEDPPCRWRDFDLALERSAFGGGSAFNVQDSELPLS